MKSNFEIIDALERAIKRAEYVCSNYCDDIEVSTIKDAIDIINRQKAEIEELKEKIENLFISFEVLGGVVMRENESETDTSVSLVDGHIEAEKGR